MANFTTSDQVITTVLGLLNSINVPQFDKVKPTGLKLVKYIVVNSLPIGNDVMQKCYVNVNYHVADLAPGIPNSGELQAISQAILTILKKVSTTTYLIDFESQETFKEEALQEHFSNLRFSFKTINN